jgi:hypothetical protein
MATERERMVAEAWRRDVEESLGLPVVAVASFHRVIGMTEAMTGSWGMLADSLMRRRRPASSPGRLPIAFLLAVTEDHVHAFDYTHRGREGVKVRAEAARWPRGAVRAEIGEGRRELVVVLSWEGGAATCRAGVNARAVAELLAPA